MPFKTLFEAMMNGWWIGPHHPISEDPDKACLPDYVRAYQSYHAMLAECEPDAVGYSEAELLEAINRVTIERGGPSGT